MKNRYTPACPIFFYIKVGFKGVYISRTSFPDEENYTKFIFRTSDKV